MTLNTRRISGLIGTGGIAAILLALHPFAQQAAQPSLANGEWPSYA